MKGYLLIAILFLGVTLGVGLVNVSAQTGKHSGESERDKLLQAQYGSLSAPERLAWREIQDRIDRMSHAEEAKDLAAAMHFMADDYVLYTLPDKDSPAGKTVNREQVAVYKRQNLDSLYSTSPETHTDIESLSTKGNVATVIIHQHYVRTIRGSDGSPHEVRTSVRHRETWVYSERGWLEKSVQELAQGPIFLDGQLYQP